MDSKPKLVSWFQDGYQIEAVVLKEDTKYYYQLPVAYYIEKVRYHKVFTHKDWNIIKKYGRLVKKEFVLV